MNKYIIIASLLLICGCIGDTTTINGNPVKIINDKNGHPVVIQYFDANTGKMLYSKNVNSDPSIIKQITYTSSIPYMYVLIPIALIIVIYLIIRVWKLGKDEGETNENENSNNMPSADTVSNDGNRRSKPGK
jgi:hypothetical protein